MVGVNFKSCSKCGKEKPTTDFCKDSYKNDGLASWCRECQSSKAKIWYANNRDVLLSKFRLTQPDERKELKKRVLTYYGGGIMCCVKCQENDLRCLTLDHINGQGNAHRRLLNIKDSKQMYRWLEKNNYPEGYQTLCMNCQFKKEFSENGYGGSYVLGAEIYP
uniref:Putative HNH endonuclease n=1 Tax=viral metagenome TaxID=1070528 RepID=A0A6M3LCR8_9ZZZZ